MKRLSVVLLSLFFWPVIAGAGSFELADGDRVVFLGSEFTEQAIKHNYLEAALTAQWPDRRVHFFNMGWSGDTPTAIARGYFGREKEGFERLQRELERIKPTVIFVCYGSNLEVNRNGSGDVDTFRKSFERLYQELESRTKRIVVVAPPSIEVTNAHPNMTDSERQLRRKNLDMAQGRRVAATQVLRDFVKAKDNSELAFVDLLNAGSGAGEPLTWDGMRFRDNGYQRLAEVACKQLGIENALDNLENGRDDKLRSLIADKNEFYFRRYRPQNETYLRGFRKHEQGQNAKEIAEFDALIEQSEDRIYAHLANSPLPDAVAEPDPVKLSFEAATPDEQRDTFKLAEGLEVALFAAEPMVENPIHMNFDAAGRLWVATSPIYPHIRPGARARDRVVVLEDSDGDGVADKQTVFADDLLIPTAVLPDEEGGAFIANSTELVHLKDTDGDGKADQRRVVLAGFGTEDTHHILHTFRWGTDGAVYFNQSIYIHTHMETPFGVKRLWGSGIWRFFPNTGQAEIVMRGMVNPWGHIFNHHGQTFATDGAGGEGIYYGFLGSAYQTAVGFPRLMRGLNPGQPKLCSLEFLSGRHWPAEWQESFIANDFRGNRVNRFQLSPQESGYASKKLDDVLSSSHAAFRPVDLKIGPDNALYIADWYNPIINHGEVDFRDTRRDYKHGRIWRVSVKGRDPVVAPNFANASIGELLEMLNLPEQRSRHMARVYLARKPRANVLAELKRATQSSANDDLRMRYLWTYEAVHTPNQSLLNQMLKADDHRHRAAAVRTLGHWLTEFGDMFDGQQRLQTAIADSHPQVRLEALGALRSIPSLESAETAMRVMDAPLDVNLDYGLWLTMRELEEDWLPPLKQGKNVAFRSDAKQLLFALKAVGNPDISQSLIGLLSSKELSANDWAQVANLVADGGKPEALGRLFDFASNQRERRDVALAALVKAARSKKSKPELGESRLERLEEMSDHPDALRLAGLWEHRSMLPQLRENAAEGGNLQNAALEALGSLKDRKGLAAILDSSEQPSAAQHKAIAALAEFDVQAAATRAAERMADLKPEAVQDAEELVAIFTRRKNGASNLAVAVESVVLDESIAAAAARRASSAGKAAQGLVKVLGNVGAAQAIKNQLDDSEMKKLIADVVQRGDAARGESIYRRSELNCLKCHAIGGAGGVLGPDMVSLGASSPVDYIVTSLLDPSAKIKEGYHTTTIVTDDGRQISGRVITDDGRQVVVRNADDQTMELQKNQIDEMEISTTSLMPVGLVAKLPRDELIDLVAFLSSLGKEGQFKVTPNLYVRRWTNGEGQPFFSRVDGSLPIEDLGENRSVRFQLDVTTAGDVVIAGTDDALTIKSGDQRLEFQNGKTTIKLDRGQHELSLDIAADRKTPLLLEVVDTGDGRAVPINQ